MPVQTKSTLHTNVSSTFLDNITGSITPTTVRTNLNDFVDSWLDQIVPGTGAASGSMVFWSDTSTTAQLILGASGTLLFAGASAPAYTPAATITINPTGTAAPQLTVAASTDSAGIQIQGTSQTVQLFETATGGLLRVSTAGRLDFGTSNAVHMALQTDGGLFATGLASQGSGTANFKSFVAGITGTAAGQVKIAGSTSPSAITLTANPTGTAWSLQLQPSAGASASLFGLTGATAATWITAGQIPGDQTGVVASAGNVGEFISSANSGASAVTLSSGAASNIRSISLTAGDWDVFGNISFQVGATTPITNFTSNITSTSATIVNLPGSGVQAQYLFGAGVSTGWTFQVGTTQVIVSTTTNIFLVGFAGFASGSVSAFGFLGGRRRR